MRANLWRGVAAGQTNVGYPVVGRSALGVNVVWPFCGRPVRLRHTSQPRYAPIRTKERQMYGPRALHLKHK